MSELAPFLVAMSALVGSADGGAPAPVYTPLPRVQMSQVPPGQNCVTPSGTCRITTPRPVNTQCFCGNVPGVVRQGGVN